MKERLLQFISEYNLTSTKLAVQIKVQPSSISHILSGRNKPSFDFITKLLDTYKDLNADWLLLGRGHMLKDGLQIPPPSTDYVQPDLFSQKSQEEISQADKTNVDIPIEKMQSELIKDETEIFNTDIEKIVIFYADGSFKAYKNRS